MTFTWSPWEWEEVREEGGRGKEGDKELEKRKEGTNERRRGGGEGEERGRRGEGEGEERRNGYTCWRETFGSSANSHNQRVLVVCYRYFRNIYWHNFGMYDLMECANVYVLLCFFIPS